MFEGKRTAYLTFDDGPNEATELILDTLARHQAEATFFMLEPQIRRFRDTARRIIRDGHAAGLHGVTHREKQFYASERSILRELNKTRKTLRRVTGEVTVLVRTPYGSIPHMKPSYLEAVRRAGYQVWDWNVDSLDWKYRDARLVEQVIKRVNRLENAASSPPLVILLHDLPETARLLPEIIRFMKGRGYLLKRLEPWLEPVRIR
ncbi:polysaccharide deacetylase family protein [Brevibacillus massiliensis]|jgi:peptidoglycan/xylan/chitin deacetylase (PgdA/CDA1 family)|uniref:polysaccharide deacetylase family protein n=1 Tax=Brevibacillus massiliensis TaxID=1118054 RepID=UPI0002F1BE04|nr:polysaccharide deacetylase family protein [Brevibacillus massiliensis]